MLVTSLLLIAGLLFSGSAIVLLIRRRRLLAAGVSGLVALPFLLTGGISSIILLNLRTYQQLTHEVLLAEVRLGQQSSEGIPLRLVQAGGSDTYLIKSPEWRLDARFVKWKPWLTLFGKEPVVRLERLEERGPVNDAQPQAKGYNLVAETAWADQMISALTEQIGLVDSVYGSSVYMPVIPEAEYQVTASISGLVARPKNQTGRRAVIEWSRQ
jgi:hypothetical protein